ncbi:hypothetical protein, partial [uncultured Megasphaera sp.]|uniref:hypothetical protein n=1 Tax=uncultured Megasphaera sp. TaxID=165188 RepID=UPI0027DB6BBF
MTIQHGHSLILFYHNFTVESRIFRIDIVKEEVLRFLQGVHGLFKLYIFVWKSYIFKIYGALAFSLLGAMPLCGHCGSCGRDRPHEGD